MDYGPLAARYDELRPAGESWLELAERTLALLGQARRLLDVGCGTGRFTVLAAERLGCRAWGVDPSAEMLAAARARPGASRVGWRRAGAEALPFRDGWFDALHTHLVLHAVADLPRALAEMARVSAAGGRLAAVSFDPAHFAGFYLNPYFPSLAAFDSERFPEPATLVAGLEAAGFAEVRCERLKQQRELDPAEVLERVRGRFISTLHLLPQDEYEAGLERLAADVGRDRPPFGAVFEWALLSARR